MEYLNWIAEHWVITIVLAFIVSQWTPIEIGTTRVTRKDDDEE